MKKILFAAFIGILMTTACEEKPVVIPEFVPIESDKVILVDDLTGVKCPNCPTASARLESIKELYPNNIITVGVHGIDNAKPLDESLYDFRNQDAADLEIYLKSYIGKPAAYFNRVQFPELLPHFGNSFSGQWQGYIERELEKPLQMNVFLSHEFDADTRTLDIEVTAQSLEDLTGDFHVTVLLTESGIIDAQEYPTHIDEEYEHNHVLMDIITAFDGDFIADRFVAGEPIEKTFSYVLEERDGLHIPERMELIAFVSNVEGESKEILQATSAHLLE